MRDHIEAMMEFTTLNRSSTTSLACTNAQFGDPAPAEEKQCICELSSITREKRVAARGSYVEDYRCDDWTDLHAVRCCADEVNAHRGRCGTESPSDRCACVERH